MLPLKNKTVLILIVCLVCVIGLVWYESLPHPSGPNGLTNYWVIYTLTPNGNHTQMQSAYYNGNVYNEQIYSLSFNNRHGYFKCTPSMTGCTLDGCTFTVLVDNATEYQVKTGEPCGP